MHSSVAYCARYFIELLSNSRKLSRSIGNVSHDRSVSDYLSNLRIYSASAMGLLGSMFYDIAIDTPNLSQRRNITTTSSRLIP